MSGYENKAIDGDSWNLIFFFFTIEIVNHVFQSISNLTLFHQISCCLSGTKGVAKAMKEISSGAQKWEGEKWYSELSDKRMYCNLIFSKKLSN